MNKYSITYFSQYCKKMGYVHSYNHHYFYEINKYTYNNKMINSTYIHCNAHSDVNTIYKNIKYPPYQYN